MKSFICLIILILISFSGCTHYDKFQVSNKAFHWYKDNSKKFSLRKDYGMFELEAYCRRKTKDREFHVYVIIHNQTDKALIADFADAQLWLPDMDNDVRMEVFRFRVETKSIKVPAKYSRKIELITTIDSAYDVIPLAQSIELHGITVTRAYSNEFIVVEPLEFAYMIDEKKDGQDVYATE
ncbi:MAG: hypothetical protein R3F48_01145 [Candidatus Zixiibacteriota bacterium]